MANTITLTRYKRGNMQFQGAFKDMWAITASIDDQDAVAINDTLELSVTVPGVVLGDMVIGVSLTLDLDDGTDQGTVTGEVTAADTVTVKIQADVGELAADAVTGAVVKILVGRPAW